MYPHQCTRLEDLLNALSSGLRGAAIEMSERLDLQVDLIIINMISAICSQYQGLADYENLEGRRRPISENVIIVGPKASGKTKAGRAIFDGLKDLDKQVAAARDDVKQEREFERKLWDDEEKVLRSKYRRSLKDGLPTKADVEKLSQHAKIRKEKIAIFQLFYEKITLAGIEKLLSNPGIAITFASDEGFKVAESGPLKDPGMASQAFDGTPQSKFTASSSYRTDDYRLSMRLDFQPEVFEKIFLTPGNQQVMVGFMQRCLYYFTNHVHDGGSPDAKKGPMEEQFLAGLLHTARTYIYCQPAERTLLQFSDKAKGAWHYINEQFKQMSQWDGPLARMPAFQRRLMEHAERIACALHLGELMLAGSEISGEVSDHSLSGAATVVKFYSQHAASLFFPATQTDQERDANKLQAKLDSIFARGEPYVVRNELLRSDIVKGKFRFDAAMELVLAWGKYTAIAGGRFGSHKLTNIIVINSPEAIQFAASLLLPQAKASNL